MTKRVNITMNDGSVYQGKIDMMTIATGKQFVAVLDREFESGSIAKNVYWIPSKDIKVVYVYED